MSFTQERISVHQDRVADAYQDASDALKEIWEDVLAFDKEANKWVVELNLENLKHYEEQRAVYKVKRQEYEEDGKAYEMWEKKGGWIGGRKPKHRHPDGTYAYYPVFPDLIPMTKVIYLTPESLKLKADVARASLNPLQLSPKEVEDLIGWENGSNIQKIKDAIKKKEGAA